jgi:DNA modification methylase
MRLTERLILGDSTKQLGEIQSESVDLILTDPPYNTGMAARPSGRLCNFFDDSYSPDDYRELVRATAQESYRILRDDRACYVFINWRSLGIWLDALSASGFRLKNVIVWDKIAPGLNYQNYQHVHEFLIFAVKGRFFPQNKHTGDDQSRDIWRIHRETKHARGEEFHHETVKPEAIVRRPIEHASLPGDVVCDPFMGSGTTCVVAKTLGRGFIGIEIDPRYFKIAEERIAGVERAGVLTQPGDQCAATRRPRPLARASRNRRPTKQSRPE